VPGEGSVYSKIMIIGQAPGRNEDIEKRPFIGTSGKFLDRLIGLAGFRREDAYICSTVQYFPPENRLPTDDEVNLCKDFLFEQIDIIDPKVVILLGSLACKTVLNLGEVAKNHGRVIKQNGRTYLVSMHPAAAVRIRTKIPIMENDFRNFESTINRSL
jgi:uracil-DNA glycosylase